MNFLLFPCSVTRTKNFVVRRVNIFFLIDIGFGATDFVKALDRVLAVRASMKVFTFVRKTLLNLLILSHQKLTLLMYDDDDMWCELSSSKILDFLRIRSNVNSTARVK